MQCTKCKNDYQLDQFQFRNQTKNVRHKRCKQCMSRYYKRYYRDNRKQMMARAKVWTKKETSKNQKYLQEYLIQHPCIDCSNNDIRVLEFDHLDPSTKVNDVSRMVRDCSIKTLKLEITKCVVRCANCHRIKTLKDSGTSWRLNC